MEELLAMLLEKTEQAHAIYEREKLGGKRDDNWIDWYAAYMAEALTERGLSIHSH